MSSRACPQCGARLVQGAERCDLCGSPLEQQPAVASEEPRASDIPEPATGSEPGDDVFCNACGWKNPAGANYCSRCGAGLQIASRQATIRPPGSRPVQADEVASAHLDDHEEGKVDGSLTRHVAILVGMSVLVVIALYMVTVISKQRSATDGAEAGVSAPADVRSAAVIDEYESIQIGARFAPTVDSLRNVIASREGGAAYEARRELADFMVEIGRIDRAAIEQQRLARETDLVDDWRRAGNLLYDWMEMVNIERKTDVALLTIDALEQVLDEAPGDVDVRADLGWAYQYDPQNPMQAIEQTNSVLNEDPDHLAANYNRGVFLLRINRVDDAVQQFERVIQLAESGSPYARQAEAWIRTVEQQQSGSS